MNEAQWLSKKTERKSVKIVIFRLNQGYSKVHSLIAQNSQHAMLTFPDKSVSLWAGIKTLKHMHTHTHEENDWKINSVSGPDLFYWSRRLIMASMETGNKKERDIIDSHQGLVSILSLISSASWTSAHFENLHRFKCYSYNSTFQVHSEVSHPGRGYPKGHQNWGCLLDGRWSVFNNLKQVQLPLNTTFGIPLIKHHFGNAGTLVYL